WRAVLLAAPVAADVEAALRQQGFLVNAVAPDALRLAPPLVITDVDLDAFVSALRAALDAAAATLVSVPDAPNRMET
ncbi:MAG: hypothetical protein WCB04_01935, partial [Mycobacteriales bacterium]